MAQEVLVRILVDGGGATRNVNKVKESFNKLEQSVNRVQKKGKDPKATAGIDNAILMETSRLASDASFGFTAIANNLSQLINLFKTSKDATGSYAQSLRNLLKFNNLLLIGIQLLITFLPKLIKLFGGSADATRKLKDALIEAQASFKETEINIRALQGAIDNGNGSYVQRTKLVERLKKITGLQNIELDANNQLSKDSNELIEKAIKLAALEAKAKAILSLIDENNKKALIEIQKIREKESSGINKFFTLLKTLLEPISEFFSKVSEKVVNFFKLIVNNPLTAMFFPALKIGTELFDKYNEAVDGTEQTEKRRQKTIVKVKEIQDGVNKTNQQYINELKKVYDEIENLNLSEEKNIVTKKEFDSVTKQQIEQIQKHIEAIRELGKIREEYFKKNEDLEVRELEFAGARIIKAKQQRLAEIKSIIADEEYKQDAILQVNKYYDKLLLLEKKEALQDLTAAFIQAAGEQSKVGKIVAIAQALFNTYEGITAALKVPPPLGEIYAATRALLGFAQVRNILQTDPSNPRMAGSSVGSGSTVEAPDFNVVGASQVSQLGRLVSAQQNKPLKAFVVGKEISSQQELDRNITNTAGI
tara:strand:- start:2179 stop:3951 length:1773 start_codon:yes stop_codon:yes gene_type:complete